VKRPVVQVVQVSTPSYHVPGGHVTVGSGVGKGVGTMLGTGLGAGLGVDVGAALGIREGPWNEKETKPK